MFSNLQRMEKEKWGAREGGGGITTGKIPVALHAACNPTIP